MLRYLTTTGRYSRWEFWKLNYQLFAIASIFLLAGTSLIRLLDKAMTAAADSSALEFFARGMERLQFEVVLGLLILFAFTTAVYAGGVLIVQIGRWHDRNKSGWWVFLNCIPFAGTLWVLIELGILRGPDGDNRYGAPGAPPPWFFDPSGRSARGDYVKLGLVPLIAGAALLRLSYEFPGNDWGQLISVLLVIPLFSMAVVLHTRRFHDLGRSGFFVLLYLIPILGPLAVILWLALAPGQKQDNRYGQGYGETDQVENVDSPETGGVS